jgi:hypothetical protein
MDKRATVSQTLDLADSWIGSKSRFVGRCDRFERRPFYLPEASFPQDATVAQDEQGSGS